MDPKTLDTLGQSRIGGAVTASTFGAHYRVAAEADGSRRWVGFSSIAGFGGSSSVIFYEFAEDGSLLHETKHVLQVRHEGGVLACCRRNGVPHSCRGAGAPMCRCR
jgi:all-trans-8'-apo-beta-carotenal 15,15'-oxygenase